LEKKQASDKERIPNPTQKAEVLILLLSEQRKHIGSGVENDRPYSY